MNVTQLAQTEPVSSGGVHIAIHCHNGTRRGHFEHLTDLNVHLKVGNGTPVVRGCKRRTKSDVTSEAAAGIGC